MLSVKLSFGKLHTLIEELGFVIERLEDRQNALTHTINASPVTIAQVEADLPFFRNEQGRLRRILEAPESPYQVAREGGPPVGGAMIKTLPELIADLRASPTEATLRNVLSDLKQSNYEDIVRMAEYNEAYLDGLTPLQKQSQVLMIVREVMNFLPRYVGRGGAMIKNFTQLIADIEADPSEATLRNVLSDLKESDHEPVKQYAQTLEGYFDALSPDQKEAALPGIYIELVPFLGTYARRERRRRGGSRKTRKSQRRKNLRRV
jgi:hypothetical protein